MKGRGSFLSMSVIKETYYVTILCEWRFSILYNAIITYKGIFFFVGGVAAAKIIPSKSYIPRFARKLQGALLLTERVRGLSFKLRFTRLNFFHFPVIFVVVVSLISFNILKLYIMSDASILFFYPFVLRLFYLLFII